MSRKAYTLGDIARELGAELRGDPALAITGLGTLTSAGPSELAFLSNPHYAAQLASTRAAAVILSPKMADKAATSVLLLDNPYLGYARISQWFDRSPVSSPGIHPTAVVDPSARVPDSVHLGPHVVIGEQVVLGERVVIEAGTIIGPRCQVGDDTIIRPRVTLVQDVTMGQRCHILSGAVIASDGFGFAHDQGVWQRIAQIGGVTLGDDVEIGANTTIDRGALEDTRLGNGVKIDNLVQISHNVSIGDHSAMAGQSGVAGSTRVGRHCVFGGQSGVGGHLVIGDGVQLTGQAMVTSSISEPGVHSSGTGVMPNREWRKNAIRFRQLDALSRRLKALEKKTEG